MVAPMNNDIKLIMLDLDGTLLDREDAISRANREALAEARRRGILVTLASGRTFTSMLPFARELDTRAPLVTFNGAWVRNPKGAQETLVHKTLSEPVARRAVELIRRRGIHINLYIDDLLMVEDDSNHAREYARTKRVPYKIVDTFDDVAALCPTKILAIDADPGKIGALKEELLVSLEAEIFRSSPAFCEILPAGIDKGWALEFLCGHFNIRPEEVMAFGDQENDINMLKKAGIGVAMGNALAAVQDAADAVTAPHDEDGVAEYLNRFLDR